MACLNPIVIYNRRYFNQPKDYVASQLLLHPEDVARQRLLVPCGHCPECLRAERNDWFVRLNREFAYQKSIGNSSWFFTLTIAPVNYSRALQNPSSYVRSFFEKVRHVYGRSVKHALFQEFAPIRGRLHFHGALFGCGLRYAELHSIAKDFGFIYLRPLNSRTLRYVVKYIVKDIDVCSKDGRLLDKKYRRKFVSPGVGRYLGTLPAPSFSCRKWTFRDRNSGINYSYRIPRYYDFALREEERRKRSTFGAFLASQGLVNDFASRIVLEALQEAFGSDWQRHVTPESFRRCLWAQKIVESYRSRLHLIKQSPSPFPTSFDEVCSCFETYLNSPSLPPN